VVEGLRIQPAAVPEEEEEKPADQPTDQAERINADDTNKN
jgi:hypothetical protein